MSNGHWRWGILGAGAAARGMAAALQAVNGRIEAIASRREETARELAAEYGIQRVHATPDALVNDPDLDVIYIASPHDSHHHWMKAAVAAGRHVLCEKAITLNSRQLAEVCELARQKNVLVLEAMTIHHMPLYRKLRALIGSGALGRVRLVQVNFGSWRVFDPESRFFSRDLAGGALLDIGVYSTAVSRGFLDAVPTQVLTRVDEQSGISLKNDRGQLVVMALSLTAKQPKRGVVSCEKGYIEISEYPRADSALIHWTDDGRTETVTASRREEALQYEVRDMQHYLDGWKAGGLGQAGEPEQRGTASVAAAGEGLLPPSMRAAGLTAAVPGAAPVCDDAAALLAQSQEVMAVLTEVRRQWGVTYPGE